MLIDLLYKGEVHRRAEIDDDCLPLVSGLVWRWQPPSARSLQGAGYGVTKSKRAGANCSAATLLHRLVIDAKPGEVVTFGDGNSLNCRRDNLTKAPAEQRAKALFRAAQTLRNRREQRQRLRLKRDIEIAQALYTGPKGLAEKHGMTVHAIYKAAARGRASLKLQRKTRPRP